MEINYIPTSKTPLNMNPTLTAFLEQWDDYYHRQTMNLPIFDSTQTKNWTLNQKSRFVKIFYHCRGHFHELLWFLASYAPDKKMKELILENIAEEIGGNNLSHEKLYSFVAEAVGVDITKEYIEHETYLPFCKEFNKGHLQWLNAHDWDSKISAFAALERLDNIDYINGRKLAENIGLKGKELTFFNVHIHVDHFGQIARTVLGETWEKNPQKVTEAFYFIANHQAQMWHNLSMEIFNCN